MSVISFAIVSSILPPNSSAPEAIKNPASKAPSAADTKSLATIGAAAFAALLAPAKKARKQPEAIRTYLSTRLIFSSSECEAKKFIIYK